MHTKEAVDEAQREEEGADDRSNELMLDVHLKRAHVQLGRAEVRVLGGEEGAERHGGQRAQSLLCDGNQLCSMEAGSSDVLHVALGAGRGSRTRDQTASCCAPATERGGSESSWQRRVQNSNTEQS